MLIIKGLLYEYGEDGDTILRAHFSGDFWAVDCTEYLTEQGLYDKGYNEDFRLKLMRDEGFSLTYDGKTYYEAEFGPYHCKDMTLLSDVSEIEHYDYTTELD